MKDRYPKLKRGEDGKPLCRGCGGKVGKGRQSWCSRECYKKNCPQEVISAVKQRDKGICQICGIDTKKATDAWREAKPNWQGITFTWEISKTSEYQKYLHRLKEWQRSCPKPEYDHIVPFSEGGPTTLENMRTLCRVCHKKRTAEWRRSKAMKTQVPQAELWGGKGRIE